MIKAFNGKMLRIAKSALISEAPILLVTLKSGKTQASGPEP